MSSASNLLVDKVKSEYPILSAAEEKQLCEEFADNPEELHRRLVLHNIAFVVDATKKYHANGETGDDFFQRGLLGMAQAAETFNPSLGFRFTTHALNYIRKAMSDVITNSGNYKIGPITNRLTLSILDAPIKTNAGDDKLTLRDTISKVSSLDYIPPTPGTALKALIDRQEAEEVINYVVDKVVGEKAEPKHKAMVKMYLRGQTLAGIGKKFKVSKDRVRHLIVNQIKKIAKELARATPDSELGILLAHHKAAAKPRRNPEAVYQFLTENRLQIVDRVETEDERVDRLMADFDSAVEYVRNSIGQYGVVANFGILRTIYEMHCRKKRVISISNELNIPISYVRFLRARAVQMVKDFLNNNLNPKTKGDEQLEELISEEEKSKAGERLVYMKTSQYDRFLEQGKRKGDRRSWITVFYPIEGGFYTWKNYNRLRKHKSGEGKISKRAFNMLMRLHNG